MAGMVVAAAEQWCSDMESAGTSGGGMGRRGVAAAQRGRSHGDAGGGARGGPGRRIRGAWRRESPRRFGGGGGGVAASGRGRSRLKEGRGARLEGGRGGGARRRWRAGLDLAWIHREEKGAAGRICREEREGNVRGGMGKGKAAGHIKEMEIDRELLILRSTVNSASRSETCKAQRANQYACAPFQVQSFSPQLLKPCLSQ